MTIKRKPTLFYATVSNSIVLVLIALFLLVFFHSTNITNIVKRNINILVELDDKLPKGQITHITKTIASFSGVLPESVEFIPKEDAIAFMNKDMQLTQVLEENPFKDVIKFNLDHEMYSMDLIKKIKESIELEKGVVSLFHEGESLDMVESNLQKASLLILILALCFIILALAIIFNTIKLTLHNDIKEIKTMQIVGAENSFIKRPYLRSAFFISLKSITAVILFLLFLLGYIYYTESILRDIIQPKFVILSIIISFAISFLLMIFTTNRILNRFLKNSFS